MGKGLQLGAEPWPTFTVFISLSYFNSPIFIIRNRVYCKRKQQNSLRVWFTWFSCNFADLNSFWSELPFLLYNQRCRLYGAVRCLFFSSFDEVIIFLLFHRSGRATCAERGSMFGSFFHSCGSGKFFFLFDPNDKEQFGVNLRTNSPLP